MKHLGDITKIDGYKIPFVDVIVGGSPCQDLSVAGKRAGLEGERSGLFMEQIRVIKEMRKHAESVRESGVSVPGNPGKFMVWENVQGALTSARGADFAAVLTECVRVKEPEAPDIPVPKSGWPNAGVIMGDGFSLAYRIHDARFWGVPQRRKRISLVCDFDGLSAARILFKQYPGVARGQEILSQCEGLPRGSCESKKTGERASGGAGDGASDTSGYG